MRQLRDAVIPNFSPRCAPAAFPATIPRNSREAIRILDGLVPESGNLAPSESWRRMLGGRNRYNHERQQAAKARRDAILIWLRQRRRCFYCEILGEYAPSEQIIIRHGDGAMLAKALGVGRATVCRDLSAIQATHPSIFGQQNCGIDYDTYMAGWKYSHRTELGNEQPRQNLRYPNNQHGPAARMHHAVSRAIGRDVMNQSGTAAGIPVASDTAKSASKPVHEHTTVFAFLLLLKMNCPEDETLVKPVRRRSQS
ncbi:MAG: hypothetical protein HQ518_15530, partial [Rhodopirellula sp.]|nr:hypothetical protein [Rhodopirellula sp.]